MVLESILKFVVLELKLPDWVDEERVGSFVEVIVLLLWMVLLDDARNEGD